MKIYTKLAVLTSALLASGTGAAFAMPIVGVVAKATASTNVLLDMSSATAAFNQAESQLASGGQVADGKASALFQTGSASLLNASTKAKADATAAWTAAKGELNTVSALTDRLVTAMASAAWTDPAVAINARSNLNTAVNMQQTIASAHLRDGGGSANAAATHAHMVLTSLWVRTGTVKSVGSTGGRINTGATVPSHVVGSISSDGGTISGSDSTVGVPGSFSASGNASASVGGTRPVNTSNAAPSNSPAMDNCSADNSNQRSTGSADSTTSNSSDSTSQPGLSIGGQLDASAQS